MESLNTSPASNGRIFLPLLISMLGIFATSLAIIVYHFVLARHCVRRQRATTSTMENAPPPRPTGVDEKVLETIPVMPYSSLKNRNAHQSECAVCLGEMEDDDRVRLLPNCKHAFHLSCIDQWLMAHVNCPLCRSAIVAEEAGDGERTRIIFPLPAMENTRNNNNNNVSDHHGSENSTSHNAISSVGQGQPFGLFRNCYSLVLERRSSPSLSSRGLVVGLKRSLSMDHSYVVVDISESESERERDSSSSSSSSSCSSVLSLSSLRAELTRSQSDREHPPSLRHLDRISIKLLSSLSRLRVGNTDDILLPY